MEQKQNVGFWKALAIVSLALLALVSYLYYDKTKPAGKPDDEVIVEPADVETAPLASWQEDAEARIKLLNYISEITDPSNEYFIPEEDRIAVFDLDGTLYCETDPTYFDYQLFLYRVTEDPDYKDKASDFEKETAAKIQHLIETGENAEGLEVDHGRGVASSFSGLSLEEFEEYVEKFRKREMYSYDNMTLGEAFYVPMLEVVDLLQDNGFKVYIVSGTDRLIVRGIVKGTIDVPNSQIIGSDETIVSDHQEGKDGLNYVFDENDELVLGGDFIIKNLKMNKVSVIMQEIGQQPVLSFGNSTGDSSMAEFVTSGNPYRSLAFMLCCDDEVRENGSQSKADKMFALCDEFDWVPISMRDDWITIYKEGVTHK